MTLSIELNQKCHTIVHNSLVYHLCILTQNVMERRFSCDEAIGEYTTDEFLMQTFNMYLKLEVLLHNTVSTDYQYTLFEKCPSII